MSRPLFRPEATLSQQDRLHGGVLIARSPTLNCLVGFAALFTIALVCFVIWGQYTRKEHVAGYLSPTQGLIKLFTPQIGTVIEKPINEGQTVKYGDVLLVISSERSTTTTRATQAALLQELRRRRDSLRLEQIKQREIDVLSANSIAEHIRGLDNEIRESRIQEDLQTSRVASAERTVARHEQLLAQGFFSKAAMEQKHEELIDQRNQLAQVRRTIMSLTRDVNVARLELSSSGLKQANNTATIERQISELEQQLTETDIRRSIVLTAPSGGTVTAILAEIGQTVNPNTPLLSILPAGAKLQAQLLIPTRAVGFIKTTQQVALRYQAFPYQRFGHHLGEVVEVSRTVIQPNESNLPIAIQEPVYRVTVSLPQQHVQAYGQAMALQAGMMVDADIRIDRRRLIEWIFDPLLSITGRV